MIQILDKSTLIHISQDGYSIYIEVWNNNHVVTNVFKDKKQILNVFGTIGKCLKEVKKLLNDKNKNKN